MCTCMRACMQHQPYLATLNEVADGTEVSFAAKKIASITQDVMLSYHKVQPQAVSNKQNRLDEVIIRSENACKPYTFHDPCQQERFHSRANEAGAKARPLAYQLTQKPTGVENNANRHKLEHLHATAPDHASMEWTLLTHYSCMLQIV